MKTVLKTVIVMVLLTIFGGIAFIFSGFYNVAATSQDSGLVAWTLETVREASIESRAEEVTPPEESLLTDPKTLRMGFTHYNEMCIMCHGAPGIEPGEARKGLNPKPPLLAEEADEISVKEMYWVIKHGIKMTGMPAWGPTHSDENIWAMVAFVKSLPKMTPEEYQIMRKETEMTESHEGDGHSHAEGSGMH